MRNKTAFLLFGVVIGFALTVTAVWAFDSFWDTGKEAYIIEESAARDGEHKLAIVADGAPQFPFGGQTVHIRIDDLISTVPMTIDTNGAEFSDYRISWQQGYATVVLNAGKEEQTVYKITFAEDKTDRVAVEIERR